MILEAGSIIVPRLFNPCQVIIYKFCIFLFHFVDDWELDEDKEWDETYNHVKEVEKEGTSTH